MHAISIFIRSSPVHHTAVPTSSILHVFIHAVLSADHSLIHPARVCEVSAGAAGIFGTAARAPRRVPSTEEYVHDKGQEQAARRSKLEPCSDGAVRQVSADGGCQPSPLEEMREADIMHAPAVRASAAVEKYGGCAHEIRRHGAVHTSSEARQSFTKTIVPSSYSMDSALARLRA